VRLDLKCKHSNVSDNNELFLVHVGHVIGDVVFIPFWSLPHVSYHLYFSFFFATKIL